jgi:hypothetical protein
MLHFLSYQSPPFEVLENWRMRFGECLGCTDWKEIKKDDIVICEANLKHDNVRHWLNNNYTAIYSARGYLGNHRFKSRQAWSQRLSLNGWANINMRTIPYSRWETLNLSKHHWKVKNVKRVLIAPSKMTSTYWSRLNAEQWANSMLDKFPGAEVKIRLKEETAALRWATLWEDLDWADLVVSLSSAITVEAFWYGKKVISLYPCNTWAAERTTLEDWQNPKEPELRDRWHEHLAWSQFNYDECYTGEAISLLEKYLGPFSEYSPNYTYNLHT